MKNILTRSMICLFAVIFISGCKKGDDSTGHEAFSGTITLSTPENGTVIASGTSFMVLGTISGNHEMHGYKVELFDSETSALIYENQYHEHEESFTIQETVTHNLTSPTSLLLRIEAAGDHEGSVVTKEIHFSYIP